MNLEGLYGWLGQFEIEAILADGTTERQKIKNLITDAAISKIRNALFGDEVDLTVKYIALGTDDGALLPLAPSNNKLGNEQFRKTFTKKEKEGTGILKSTVNIGPNEGNINIREIGIFAGANASDELNSGVMIARVFYYRDKTNLESINIIRTDTIARG